MMPPERATAERAPERLTIDVSVLPETVFGHRAVTWWATVAFMLIEGTTLAVLATSYLYLRLNAAEWPPRPASAPELLVPTIGLLVLLSAIVPMWMARTAAKRFDLAGVRRGMVLGVALCVAATVLRWFELQSLNVRWDTNAYGSALWGVVVAHTTLLLTQVLEGGAIAAIFFTDRLEPKHFSDVEDAGLYQVFLSLAWLVLFVVVILGPRVL
jgi:heme/copper-type cytochrome/quinol oxidase subunit 3